MGWVTQTPEERWRITVVDVETTGLGRGDRVVEVAAVTMNDRGDVIDEFDTLVNPERDVGPTHIHGITASMVTGAPTFAEVAAALARRLDGVVLSAHNLPFDLRFLRSEYERLGASLAPGRGVCTLRLTGSKLSAACDAHGIQHGGAHRALHDARATAELLWSVLPDGLDAELARVSGVEAPLSPRTLRREALSPGEAPPPSALSRMLSRAPLPTADGATLAYLDALDWALDDAILTTHEARVLRDFANDLGLSTAEVGLAHQRYLDLVVEGALRDGIVTPEEHALLTAVATALGLPHAHLPPITPRHESVDLRPGARLCFTGTARDAQGRNLGREELEGLARERGFVPVANVTKKGCDALVAADPASGSTKARAARRYGLPIVSVEAFLA
ncbi:MAG: 3'-5' exoribonuclease [Myxococcales bacterium]|nr:3'-5' exoribonuclease [Myxococcales bacterium]